MAGSPPPGPPWDLPVAEAPLAFVDLEMTGLDPEVDRVVEVCIERVVGGVVVDRLDSLVRPPSATGEGMKIHGIDPAAIAAAPPFEELADRVASLLDGAALVAHAAEWDAAFLRRELGRCGRDVPLEHFIDTLQLARRCFGLPSSSMDALCKHFGIPRGRAHRAADDVVALRALFDRCVALLAPESARDLGEVRVAERKARAAVLAACAEACARKIPVDLTYRASKRGPAVLRMVITEVRSDLDPPRVLGYLLPGRGRRELRADRVLRCEPAPP
ncbi:MAG: 3'-5' exonuclease [Myxococcales bacterium]|nr:3'-5' exonuclease [Myxococcales bacterium]